MRGEKKGESDIHVTRRRARLRGQRGGSPGFRAGDDAEGEPEGHQDGDGQQEGRGGDAVAQGVDGLHREEVRFLGRAETERGRRCVCGEDSPQLSPGAPVWSQGCPWGLSKLPGD